MRTLGFACISSLQGELGVIPILEIRMCRARMQLNILVRSFFTLYNDSSSGWAMSLIARSVFSFVDGQEVTWFMAPNLISHDIARGLSANLNGNCQCYQLLRTPSQLSSHNPQASKPIDFKPTCIPSITCLQFNSFAMISHEFYTYHMNLGIIAFK